MATTGAKLPTAAVTAAEDPWLDNDWVNPANIYGAGEAEVSAATFDAADQTYVLKAQGFDFSAIPDGATINGVTCVVTGRYATAPASIDLLQLLDVTSAKVGTNQAATPIALTTSGTPYTKGGAADKWGNLLDSAWVKNANFGVAIGALAGGTGNNNVDVYLDSVTLAIDYTAPVPQNYTQTVSSTVGIADTPAGSRGLLRSVSASIGLTDTAAQVWGAVRAVAEVLGLTEALNQQQVLGGAPAAAWTVNVTIGS